MRLDQVTAELTELLATAQTRGLLAPVITELERQLSLNSGSPQAWQPLPLDILQCALPDEIRSCWLFVLRAGGIFGAERHPNSHQRSVALRGRALFELFEGSEWTPWPVDASRQESSISIPPSVWHRIRIGDENFVSASFHTVAADELIEETPVAVDLSVTRQRRYHGE